MDLTAADEKLLKALAIAIVDHPRATFKEIAQAAGVSKATLNRFCGTRDNLIEMLLDHGSVVIYRVIADADLESAPLDALHRLIEGHLTHRELLVFLSFQWRPDTFDLDAGGCRWLPYSETLDEFFLRGQKLGVFRIDIGAPALTEIFSFLIFGLVDAERRGRIARAGMAALIEQFFLNGACNYQT
ncbi:TetR/AcrR family transcriptional regulator [Pseudomonas aeruginosa]|uniref:TetR/AcrR family transcriptional regulator n=1 Tax=Pseudomonas aeruginosa TaxID=287 RepID=UPI0021E1BED1|nr:transcriptional regulator [Pseudomonas aeruginosa]GLE74060.1 LacI family transcriptional regulator [Pseudomonas aeruginosa]GLE86994.1 LacI family transcriptional regulator [Pseudomonas aeruginosa]